MAGRPKPPPKPEIEPYLEFYWQAWHHLKNDRQFDSFNGSATPIFYQAMSQYARDQELGGVELDIFMKMLRSMDIEFMEWAQENKPTPRNDQAPVT